MIPTTIYHVRQYLSIIRNTGVPVGRKCLGAYHVFEGTRCAVECCFVDKALVELFGGQFLSFEKLFEFVVLVSYRETILVVFHLIVFVLYALQQVFGVSTFLHARPARFVILRRIGPIKPHVFGEAIDLVVAIATDGTVGRTAPSTLHIVHAQWTCTLTFLRETYRLVAATTQITGHLGIGHR